MRVKLIASFILIVLVTIGIFATVIVRQTAQEVRNFMNRGGLTGAEEVVVALKEYYARNQSWVGVEEVLRTASRLPRRGMWGQGLGRNNDLVVESSPSQLRLADANGNLVAYSRRQATVSGERLTQNEIRRALPLELDGRTIGYLLPENIQVFTEANQLSLIARLNRAAIIAVVIAGGGAVLLALLLSFSLVQPVKALTGAASELATGDLSQRVQVSGSDELATLGRTFNRMAESLQEAEESRRAMTADIAHELRTPLAVQRAHLEAIEDGVYPLTLENLTTIEEQNHLLTRLVDDLRTLALADSGQLNLEITQTDFHELVKRVAARFTLQAADREITFQQSLAECPPLNIDSQRIQQILHNLLSNAMRYSPDGGRILLELNCSPKFVELSVRDGGPGIPADGLTRIFDRFYRADKSRARTEGGTGLGLSIARKLAQAHGGDLTAANHPDGGAVFSLTLPIGMN